MQTPRASTSRDPTRKAADGPGIDTHRRADKPARRAPSPKSSDGGRPPAAAKASPAPLPPGVEVELKLAADPDVLADIAGADAIAERARSRGVHRRLESVYYDTPERELAAGKLALRVRRQGRQFVQTLKAGEGVGAGALSRGEWETPVPSLAVDPSAFAAPTARAWLANLPVDRVAPVFTTRVRRHIRRLEDAGDPETGRPASVIELAVDRGEIETPRGTMPISELELELKAGPPEALYRLALDLAENKAVGVELRSKSARGLALADGAAPGWRKSEPLSFASTVSVDEAIDRVLRQCLRHWTVNQDAAVDGRDPEGVHQMRVALRRLRSALVTFGRLIDPQKRAWLSTEVKWLANALGAARDWDVFLAEQLAPPAAALTDDPALSLLAEAAEAERARGYDQAREAIASPRTTRLILELALWIERRGWYADAPDRDALDRPLVVLADRLLGKRHRRVLKLGRGFANLTTDQRHELRIAVKKLRYTAEFFASLYKRKRTRPFLSRLSDLQDRLGHLQDVAIAQGLVDQILADAKAGRLGGGRVAIDRLGRAAGMVVGWQLRGLAESEPGLLADWRGFSSADPFWHRAKA